MNMSVATSSVNKGETLIDTAITLNAMRPDIIVVRHAQAGAAHLLARKVDCAVVNAGDGAHEHPTQALLDGLTIRRNKGRIENLNRGHLRRRAAFPAGPLQHHPAVGAGRARARRRPLHLDAHRHRPNLGVEVFHHHARGVEGRGHRDDAAVAARAHDPAPSFPRPANISGFSASTRKSWRSARPDALVMHPGPMNRGVEIDFLPWRTAVQSLIREQVEMGVAVRMAVLEALARTLPNG